MSAAEDQLVLLVQITQLGGWIMQSTIDSAEVESAWALQAGGFLVAGTRGAPNWPTWELTVAGADAVAVILGEPP